MLSRGMWRLQSGRISPSFRRNVLPLSSGSTSKSVLSHAGCLACDFRVFGTELADSVCSVVSNSGGHVFKYLPGDRLSGLIFIVGFSVFPGEYPNSASN